MGILGDIFSYVAKEIMETIGNLPVGRMALSAAAENAPMEMGCYKLIYNNEVKYVGRAVRLRSRFREHYNGRGADSSSANRKISEHRDEIIVMWVVCTSSKQCEELEFNLLMKDLPSWNLEA